MRKGYWRTLTRQMRDKVALGDNAFIWVDGTAIIMAVEADPDADLEPGHEVLLAHDDSGYPLMLDTATSTVFLMQADGTRRVLASDLMTFINALSASAPPSLSLGDAIGELLDFAMPRRGILDD